MGIQTQLFNVRQKVEFISTKVLYLGIDSHEWSIDE